MLLGALPTLRLQSYRHDVTDRARQYACGLISDAIDLRALDEVHFQTARIKVQNSVIIRPCSYRALFNMPLIVKISSFIGYFLSKSLK